MGNGDKIINFGDYHYNMDNSKKELYIQKFIEALRERLSEQDILDMKSQPLEQLEATATMTYQLLPPDTKEILDPADILEALRRLIASY